VCVVSSRAACRASFLGAFAKLQKAIISFDMSVRPSVCTEKLGTQRIFMKFDISVFLENFRANSSVIKI
jgi:hypothetical protein